MIVGYAFLPWQGRAHKEADYVIIKLCSHGDALIDRPENTLHSECCEYSKD